MASPKRSRGWQRLVLVFAGAAAALALGEITVRSALFGDGVAAQWVKPRFREAKNFANSKNGEDFWKLKVVLDDWRARPDRPPIFHPVLGWLKKSIDPETYAPLRVPGGGRKPVVLYGDSFAACVWEVRCYEDLMRESDLRPSYGVVNCGVGGYGLDQMYLLLRATLPHFRSKQATVVVSLLPEDLDRTTVGLRGWPKPRFELADGELVEPGPVASGSRAYLADSPLEITSYLWRYLLYGSRLLPESLVAALDGSHGEVRAKQALARALVRAMVAEVEAAEVDYFFLVFDQQATLDGRFGPSWHLPFLEQLFAELDLPYVHTRPDLLADQRTSGRPLDDYFILSGKGAGHYSNLGNELTFRTLRRGLQKEFDTTLEQGPEPTAASSDGVAAEKRGK